MEKNFKVSIERKNDTKEIIKFKNIPTEIDVMYDFLKKISELLSKQKDNDFNLLGISKLETISIKGKNFIPSNIKSIEIDYSSKVGV